MLASSVRASLVFFAVVGSLLAGTDRAMANGYATDDAGFLYEVFTDEKRVDRIGAIQVRDALAGKKSVAQPTLTDLALSDLHGMYGISFTHLYRIDLRDPSRSQRVGPLRGGNGFFNALAFDESGKLYALEYGTIYLIDVKTGKATRLGALGGTWSSAGDLVWLGDALYATVNKGFRACHLVRIDMKTWRATDVGRIRSVPPAKPKKSASTKGSKKGPAKKDAPKKRVAPILRPRTYDAVWGLIWDGQRLHGLTEHGDVVVLNHRTAVATPLMRVRGTFYGACARLRL